MEHKHLEDLYNQLLKDYDELQEKIDIATKLIESYNLGKHNYSIPPGGIIELLDILKGDSNE